MFSAFLNAFVALFWDVSILMMIVLIVIAMLMAVMEIVVGVVKRLMNA